MSISWRLDEEDGVDPDELLGAVVLQDSDGNQIEESIVFLDSFFLAMAEGLVAVDGGESRARVELFDAPVSLTFDRSLEQVSIECRGRSVCFPYENIVRDLVDSYSKMAEYVGFAGTIPNYIDLNEAIAALSAKL
ncbi:hypothetical protein ACFOZ5_15515 [Marinobacter lacisalsi]|uniref:Uncharacterized protein n=1 Tax=Marinobacter lacisalsi TaxID=475979 RepID=A0ABV8QJA2_9GAMM